MAKTSRQSLGKNTAKTSLNLKTSYLEMSSLSYKGSSATGIKSETFSPPAIVF